MKQPTSAARQAARAATRPVRDYINAHFEMTKQEIREAVPRDEQLAGVVAELANVIAETQLHHSRLVGDLRDRIEDLESQIASSQRTLDRLTEVVAASTLLPEVTVEAASTSAS